MPTVIVPVGLNLGPSYRYTTPPDPSPEHWEVRLGTEAEESACSTVTVAFMVVGCECSLSPAMSSVARTAVSHRACAW
jgi:hypothetical protein